MLFIDPLLFGLRLDMPVRFGCKLRLIHNLLQRNAHSHLRDSDDERSLDPTIKVPRLHPIDLSMFLRHRSRGVFQLLQHENHNRSSVLPGTHAVVPIAARAHHMKDCIALKYFIKQHKSGAFDNVEANESWSPWQSGLSLPREIASLVCFYMDENASRLNRHRVQRVTQCISSTTSSLLSGTESTRSQGLANNVSLSKRDALSA